jgi:hypothetical protein
MTNREWLSSLSSEQLAKVVGFTDCFLLKDGVQFHCPFWKDQCPPSCEIAFELWLNKEYTERNKSNGEENT